MTVTQEELDALVGYRLPGGEFSIEPWYAWLIDDVCQVPDHDAAPESDPQRPEPASPLFAYLAATAAMGVSWDELFKLCHASAADGPMFGECDIECNEPLFIGQTYRVAGGIESATRKRGRTLGVFDLVGLRLDLYDRAGSLVATCRNSVTFPRRSEEEFHAAGR